MSNTNDSEKKLTGAQGACVPESQARFGKQAERLRREVPIAKVIGEDTKLRGRKRLVGRCTLHEEPNPVLSVNPKTNTFRCFGCGAEGDAIDYLMKVRGLMYGQALEALEEILYSDEYLEAA